MSKAEKNRISKLLPFSVVITPFIFIFGHIFAWIFYSDFGIDYLALASFNSGGYFVISHPFLILFPLIVFLNTLFYFSYFYYKYHRVNDLGDSIGSLSREVGGIDKEFSRISLMISDLRDKTRENRYLIRKKIQAIRYFRNEEKEINFIKLNELDSSMASLRVEYKKTLRDYIFASKEIAYQKERTFSHRSKIERYDDIVSLHKNGRLSKIMLIFHVFVLFSFLYNMFFYFPENMSEKEKEKIRGKNFQPYSIVFGKSEKLECVKPLGKIGDFDVFSNSRLDMFLVSSNSIQSISPMSYYENNIRVGYSDKHTFEKLGCDGDVKLEIKKAATD